MNYRAFVKCLENVTKATSMQGKEYNGFLLIGDTVSFIREAQMVPPTFESNREKNNFTLRLLFHNFLSQEDLSWLDLFKVYDLNDNQQLSIVFIREVGALDNTSYRQLCGINRSQAGVDLRSMRQQKLIEQKNTGKSTYYLPTSLFLSTMVDNEPTMVGNTEQVVPEYLKPLLTEVGRRSNPELIRKAILMLCEWKDLSISELAEFLNRNEKYIKTNYIQTLLNEKTIPAMLTHPSQKYRTISAD